MTRSHAKKNYNKLGSTNNNGVKGIRISSGGWNNNSKEIKCWACKKSHLYKNFPHYNPNRKMGLVSMLHESSTINDTARNIRRINVDLEDRKAGHQSTMLEVEGKILNTLVSILIDSWAILSYIAPKVVEKCKLSKEKQKKCMVGIAGNKDKKESYGDN